uniref:Protein POLYCHOME n=1 Tax=Kalanchoe fedtschenkoi TaxID=63787 RepID=A0A7N0V2C3_KALFE
MAEARDRLSRPEDVAATFARQRRLIRQNQIFVDESERRLGGLHASTREAATRRNVVIGRRRFGTPRTRVLYGSVGRENVVAGGTGRRLWGRASVLPSWYPRTPLRDITHVVRAIECRRAYLRDRESQQSESPLPIRPIHDDPSASSSTTTLEHDPSFLTPMPSVAAKHYAAGKVPRILLDITNQNSKESELLTPQKKLLNSIDKVEKVVMEELRRQKRTPSARKAERDKRLRALMSMR